MEEADVVSLMKFTLRIGNFELEITGETIHLGIVSD